MDDTEVFVVRIWHRSAGGFSASVRRVDEEETHHFAQPEEVTCFLTAAAKPGATLDEAAQRAGTTHTRS